MNYDKKYPDVYKGYFNYREPFTEKLEDIYQSPVVIPIYHIDELFNEQALNDIYRLNEISNDPCLKDEYDLLNAQLKERDINIFRYFHFIAAQRHVLYELKMKYRDFYELEHTLKQFEAIGYDVSKARATDLIIRKKALLDFQAGLCYAQLV
jgi:phosphoglycerol transferase MdoB-like AlkP superfamily enzyme